MKIKSLEVKDYAPIKHLKMDDLGDIVIIAGANGSGKTRLKQAIVSTLQGGAQMSMLIVATRAKEKEDFGEPVVEISQGATNQNLIEYMQKRRFGRGQYVGSLVQIDSNRNIQTIKYQKADWFGQDPDEQETPSNWGYQNFSDRWQEFMNGIHQKYAARDRKLANELKKDPGGGLRIMEENPDPLEKYKNLFSQLLPGKELQDIQPESPREFHYKNSNGNILPFSSLSSGEQEVVKVIFDVARKDIKDSIIIVDEPELHLHPTLTFKLIETLKTVGDHTNQFIFLTHSADLISTYYSTGNVYFVDSEQSGANQAHKLSELDRSHKNLVNMIGENLGLFAVGKKLVFVEGESSSLDRLTYHSIAQTYLPEAKIIPVGSVENILALNSLEEQIRNSIFGINFYMIRDKDGLSDDQVQQLEENGRIRCLKKKHLENYFLDPEILYKVAEKLYITSTKPDITQEYIEEKLKEIASNQLRLNLLQNTKEYIATNHHFGIPTVKSIDTKNIENIVDEFTQETSSTLSKLASDLSGGNLRAWMKNEKSRLDTTLTDGSWKNEFRGKNIFYTFCGSVFEEDKLKVRQAYIDVVMTEKPQVFEDIKDILESFN